MSGLPISPLQRQYAQSVVDTNIDAVKKFLERKLHETPDDIQVVLSAGQRIASGLPIEYADRQFLDAYALLHPKELQEMITKSLQKIPWEYRAAIREVFMVPKPEPVVHEEERGTRPLEYRC